MKTKMPRFDYQLKQANNKYSDGSIKLDGKVIHEIANRDMFLLEFGYTQNINMMGVLPDEFIWDEYVNNKAVLSANCLQIRIVEYLLKHSDTFRAKYGALCERWIADHAKETIARGVICAACRMESFCDNLK